MELRLLEHPADVGIEINASSLKEAFEAAARGMMSIIVEDLPPDGTKTPTHLIRSIEVDGIDGENLLVNWLSEILYLYDAEKLITVRADITGFTATSLRAMLHLEQLDPAVHHPRLDVKAVTYHQIVAEAGETSARVRVFFDI